MTQDNLTYALCGICLILVTFVFITKALPRRRKQLLFSMAVAAIVLLISDRLTHYYNGNTTAIGICLARTGKFLAYAMYLLFDYIFNLYAKDMLTVEGGMSKPPKSLILAEYILITGFVVLSVSQTANIYYYFDENNRYQRLPGYIISYIIPTTAVVIQFLTVVVFRKHLRKIIIVSLLLFLLTPIIASICQFFYHGVSLTGTCIVAMVALLYCFSILDANKLVEIAHQKEVDILLEKQKNINLMIKQTAAALAEAIDAKDSYTNGHSRRVAEYSVMIAEKAGKTKEECEEIYLMALLHDVGKIGIPDAIINKEGRLSDEEYATIKTHPEIGREILSKIHISPELAIGASFHHERYDGKGYPFGLKGEEIPEMARMIAVADTYDAMASKRSYRNVLPKEKIRSELVKGVGTQFDPRFAAIMIGFVDAGIVGAVQTSSVMDS